MESNPNSTNSSVSKKTFFLGVFLFFLLGLLVGGAGFYLYEVYSQRSFANSFIKSLFENPPTSDTYQNPFQTNQSVTTTPTPSVPSPSPTTTYVNPFDLLE